MYRILLIFLMAFFCLGKTKAQPDILKTDSITWLLYTEKKWDQLIMEAEGAFRNNIDFYYLRVRAGVAAYELKKYRKAASHFQKAYRENPSDDFLNGYYYWSLVLSGRQDEADRLADGFTPDALKKQQIKKKGTVSGITAESLLSGNRQYSELIDEDIESANSYSNYRAVLKQQQYWGLALDHHLQPRLNLYHSLSTIAIDRTEMYKSTSNLLDTLKEATAVQYQYYISGRYLLGSGWSLTGSLTRLWGKSYYHIPEYLSPGLYNLNQMSWGISDWVVCTGVAKEGTYFRPQLEFGFGEVNRYRQLQTNFQLTVYPTGNVDFYLIPEGSLHHDGTDGSNRFVFTQKAGLKAGPLWLTGEYGTGRIKNYFTGHGLVVYNMPETILNKAGITIWAPLFKYRMELTARYLRAEKEGMTFVYSDASNFIMKPYTFTDHSFLISLKWNL